MASSYLPLFTAIAEVLLCVLVFFVPVGVVIAFMVRSKRAYETAAAEPFTDLPLRPPGESARLKADALFTSAMENFAALLLASGVFGLVVALTPSPRRLAVGLPAGGATIVLAVIIGLRVQRLLHKSWDYRLGFKGERMVGEELNQLLALGYRVYHDVLFENFNIDHVVIGPAGVFVVETKTRRKRKTRGTQASHVVIFDGKALKWPTGSVDFESTDQAERNARTVSAWLAKATGEPVKCQPIVTIPGWWVETAAPKRPEVVVCSSKGLNRFLPGMKGTSLSQERIQSISYVVAERCRSGSG